jgi:Mce-associated membrane protein
MSARTRLKAAAGEPARRRTVTRRPPRQVDGEAPAEELAGAMPAEERAAATPTGDVRSGTTVGRLTNPTSRGDRGPRLLIVCLVVALAAAVAAAGVAGYGWYAQQRLDGARQQALAAARQTTVNFVSVSAATVDRDLQRVTAGATGDFKDEFARGAPQVRTAVVENNVDSRGSVLRAALVSGDADSAVVLVAVDANVKNVKAPQGRLSHYRIQVNVTRDAKSGRWLVSKLQFVG